MRAEVIGASGTGAHMQVALLRLAAIATRPVRSRSMQTLTRSIGRLFNPGNDVEVRLADSARLRIRLSDVYWMPVFICGLEYEAEIEHALFSALDSGAQFLDLGANVGYWSVRAHARGARRIVAVEASPPTFAQLEANVALNAATVTPLLNAVWSSDGAQIEVVTNEWRHAGNSVVHRKDKAHSAGYVTFRVSTVTIDSLVREHFPGTAPLVIKLDVEGAEIEAIKGASHTLASRDVTLLYEDHGKDSESLVSKYLLDLGLDLYSEDRRVSLGDISSVKTRSSKGYNFIARN